MNDSLISGFYRLDIRQRIECLEQRGVLSAEDAAALREGRHVLLPAAADRIIENVIGVFSLPFAISPNFIVNGNGRLAPMVVEEPSIVAGLSFAAALAARNGGFEARSDEALLAGQVHLTNIADAGSAAARIEAAAGELLAAANAVHPRLGERGGGVREIEVRRLALPGGETALVVHLLVDTRDAMGANLVNTICEAVAPRIATIAGGTVAMRILSNLADRSVVTARVSYPCKQLAVDALDGETVRDAIVVTSDIAAADPYRAATHNKGIMNGIDAVAIATGNDWRAIEAGAHAYAAMDGQYRPLSRWSVGRGGELVGEIRVPLKVGVVGGTVAANPAAALGLRIAGVDSAAELAELMAAVGLAQNFAALRALATSGIQKGHMRLHARSLVAASGVAGDRFDEAVEQLVASGEITETRARDIAARLGVKRPQDDEAMGSAAGKVILLGEHAVVYGKHALALPIPGAVSASVKEAAKLVLEVPDWGLSREISPEANGVDAAVRRILENLGLGRQGFAIRVRSALPRAMGLGSSAAFAVAIVRAFDRLLDLSLGDERVNEIAFDCEKLAHGNPSGVDNTLATFARPMLFRRGEPFRVEELEPGPQPPIVIACGHQPGVTHDQVAGVRARFEVQPAAYAAIFDQIDELSVAGAKALVAGDYAELGQLMNICHGLLNALGVSTPELERMVEIARRAGAAGAKLTGAGGGGSIVAACPGAENEVVAALRSAGYSTIELNNDREAHWKT
ncbi:MAG TPA: hydroxymethylglutaryl-CoA reductase, degradative [Woeseiaceae bacterium]|nr:hydroxymethylglutaryl-CoA reductase, degradative [Woeseiaceae bacterium]